MKVRLSSPALWVGALVSLAVGVAQAQVASGDGDVRPAASQPGRVAQSAAPVRRRPHRPRRHSAAPSTAAADLAALRRDEAIVHGATSATQAPTTNDANTGGPDLRGDILKSGPTGPR